MVNSSRLALALGMGKRKKKPRRNLIRENQSLLTGKIFPDRLLSSLLRFSRNRENVQEKGPIKGLSCLWVSQDSMKARIKLSISKSAMNLTGFTPDPGSNPDTLG
jgi:hypothetical protein